MPTLDIPNFEPLHHKNLNGDPIVIPLYLDEELQLCEDSETLLRAADIISTQVNPMNMPSVLDKVGIMLSESIGGEGIIIEDELGVGSVTIDPELTRVTIGGEGIFFTPTRLLFSMLYKWTEYARES